MTPVIFQQISRQMSSLAGIERTPEQWEQLFHGFREEALLHNSSLAFASDEQIWRRCFLGQ